MAKVITAPVLSSLHGDFLRKLTAMEMIAASYDDMFKQLTDLVPDTKAMIQKEISWAKTALKKTNRITWYLRWARISVAERAVDQLESAKPFPEQEAQVAKATAIFEKWKQDATSKAGTTDWQPNQSFTALKHSLEHFFSLMSVPVQQYDPGTKSINQVLTDLEALEEEFKASTKGTLTPRPEDTVFIDCGNGWAWWLLPRASCSDESKAMGHCGNGPAAHRTDMAILSLREEKKRGKETVYEPHLTFIYHYLDEDAEAGTLGEMKGKGNAKPVAKYHPYIIKLLEDPRIQGLDGGGYMPDHNFMAKDLTEDEQKAITEKNPDALLNLKQRIDKYGVEYKGIGLAAEKLGAEVCELGFEVATYPDWGSVADESDSQSLKDLANCVEGGFAFFAKYMLAEIPFEYSYIFRSIAQEILAEFPDTVGLSVNSETIQEDVIHQLKDAFTYDPGDSPLHEKLSSVFLEAYPYGSPKSLEDLLKSYIQEDWAMSSSGDGIPSEIAELDGQVVVYVTFDVGLQAVQDTDLLREGTNSPYLGGPYDDNEDAVGDLTAAALPLLQEVFQGDRPSQRQLENKGQDRLFKRPESDEEAQRDGIKVSKVAAGEALFDWRKPGKRQFITLDALYRDDNDSWFNLENTIHETFEKDMAEGSKKIKVSWVNPDDLNFDMQSWDDRKQNIPKIAELMQNGTKFSPGVVDDGGKLVDGNHRTTAAMSIGIKLVPTIDLEDCIAGGLFDENNEEDHGYSKEYKEYLAQFSDTDLCPRCKGMRHTEEDIDAFVYTDKPIPPCPDCKGTGMKMLKKASTPVFTKDLYPGAASDMNNYIDDVCPVWVPEDCQPKDVDTLARKQHFELRTIQLSELEKAVNRPLSLDDVDPEMVGLSQSKGPIVLDSDMSVIDGMHRLATMLAAGKTSTEAWVRVGQETKTASIPEPWRNSSHARSVELVPIEELKRYREYNRLNPSEAMSEDPDAYIDELTEDIKQNGIREPLILEYSQDTGRALLTEGNHRLLAAERISNLNGMVPVRGYRRYGPFRGAHKGVVPPENNFGKDIFGKEYVPQDFKPSVIGVGGTSKGMTA